jgi:hypothetical protein
MPSNIVPVRIILFVIVTPALSLPTLFVRRGPLIDVLYAQSISSILTTSLTYLNFPLTCLLWFLDHAQLDTHTHTRYDPLYEWWARHRGRYLHNITQHNTKQHNKYTRQATGFEPTFPPFGPSRNYALCSPATGIGLSLICINILYCTLSIPEKKVKTADKLLLTFIVTASYVFR